MSLNYRCGNCGERIGEDKVYAELKTGLNHVFEETKKYNLCFTCGKNLIESIIVDTEITEPGEFNFTPTGKWRTRTR